MDPKGISGSTTFQIPASLLREKLRFQQIPGISRPSALIFPNSRRHLQDPHPKLIPIFPPTRNVGKGILLPFPRLFPAFPQAGKRRWDRIPAGAAITSRKLFPGWKKWEAGKTPGSPHLQGVGAGIPPVSRRVLGISREFDGGSQGIPLQVRGDPGWIPGKAGAAPGARKEPGQEGGSAGGGPGEPPLPREAAAPSRSRDPWDGSLGFCPRDEPRSRSQNGTAGNSRRKSGRWGAPHPKVLGWLRSRDALGIPGGNGEARGVSAPKIPGGNSLWIYSPSSSRDSAGPEDPSLPGIHLGMVSRFIPIPGPSPSPLLPNFPRSRWDKRDTTPERWEQIPKECGAPPFPKTPMNSQYLQPHILANPS